MSDAVAKSGLVLGSGDINDAILSPTWDPQRCTALIPAAGRGTRLAFEQPKILYQVAGRAILDHLVALLAPFCARFIFVLSPSGKQYVEPALSRIAGLSYDIAVQHSPRGMADAVKYGVEYVNTVNTLVIWGDQVGVRPQTIQQLLRLHEGPLNPAVTLPSIYRDKPYIHFERNQHGQMSRVLQRREGDEMPASGENDCGVFLFQTAVLKAYLPRLLEDGNAVGRRTREANFLPILPLIDSSSQRVLCARIVAEQETMGINTLEEAQAASAWLQELQR